MPTSPRPSSPALTPLGAHDPVRLGPHRLLGRLGSGGMGTVYLGRSRFGRLVAVKAVHPELADEAEFRARFAREVGALRRVRSPFVPRFVGAAPRAQTPWLATEFVSGPTLRGRVEGAGPLLGGTLTGLAAGVASALADIHAAGVVHRDLKPSNVILSPDGPRILDFGIARAPDPANRAPGSTAQTSGSSGRSPGRGSRTLDSAAHTGEGGVMGTPGWIAPERLQGAPATTASDVFSWGQLTAYAATGRNPFGRGSAEAITQRVLHGEANLAGVPEELLAPVRAALTEPPEHRPAPAQILRALGKGRGMAGTRGVASRIVRDEWSGPPSGLAVHRSRTLLRVGAALSALALAVATTVAALRFGSGEGERDDPPEETGWARFGFGAERSPGDRPTPLHAPLSLTLSFEGAPETGLLVVHENGSVENVDGAPPAGVCYSAPDGAFSTDHSTCT